MNRMIFYFTDIRGERLEALKHFLSVDLPRATLVHFEMASFVETAFVVNLTRAILPYVDSIGSHTHLLKFISSQCYVRQIY